jgi:hypothetical protein
MAITTTSDLNSLFSEIYERAVFVAREMNLMTQLVSGFSANTFYTRNLTTRPQVDAEVKPEGTDFTNATTFGRSLVGTLTPTMKMAQVVLTDEDIMNDPDNAVADASQEMGAAIATKIDTDLLGVFSSFATDVGDGAGNAATLENVGVGISVLRNNKAMGRPNVVLHPYQWHDIWLELGQPTANQAFLGDVANEALRDFFVGSFLSANWYVTSNISVDGSDDAIGGIFRPESIAFDSRVSPTMETERDASLLGWELNIHAGYAVGLGKRPTYGVKFTTDAAQPS